ncbi:MAG: AsmA family protein [Hyphomicrobiaceae bacterium]|nr:AsmA family protein [Hyphomicrobiaceae bacterium]
MSEAIGNSAGKGASSMGYVMLRALAYIVVGLLAAAAILAVVLWASPPGWLARDALIRIVEERTGRKLTIAGETRLVFRPDIRLRLGKVTLSGPPDKPDRSPLTAESLEAQIEIIDLWNQVFEVPVITLVKPNLTLIPGDPMLIGVAEGDVRGGGIPQQIVVTDGTLTIEAVPPQETLRIERISGTATRSADGKGVSYKGELAFNGELIATNVSLSDVYALPDGGTSPLSLELEALSTKAKFDGTIATKPLGEVTGQVVAETGNIPKLLAWAGIDPAGADLGMTGKIEGTIAGSLRRLSLKPATLTLEAASGVVDGEVSIEETRPSVKAKISKARIDLNKLLPAAAAPAAFSLEPLEGRLALPSAWDSLLDALEPQKQTSEDLRGAAATAASAWSSEPFKLQKLPDMDVTLAIDAEEIRYRQIPATKGRVELTSSPDKLALKIDQLGLYKGRVSGRADVSMNQGPLETAVSLEFDELALEPFTTELLKQRLVSGSGDLDMTLTARGGSMRELVGSLNGTARMEARQGAIIGFDLRRAVLSFGQQQGYNAALRTRFDKVKGAFAIRNGVLRSTEDVSLAGPEVDVSTSGTLGLVSRRLEQVMRLSLKPPPLHLPIPIKIRGTTDEPAFEWNIFGAVAEPAKFATPFAVATEGERMPDDVRKALEAKLALPSAESGLSPEARAFLEELLATR